MMILDSGLLCLGHPVYIGLYRLSDWPLRPPQKWAKLCRVCVNLY